ncbi:hypothetical protein OCA16_31045 [Bacillus cereus]|nr:hypothetical protein [Bacillus cereus]
MLSEESTYSLDEIKIDVDQLWEMFKQISRKMLLPKVCEGQ